MAFRRVIENFVCAHCGTMVKGNGYTNHCHKCLWSKHVDVTPGDRAEMCGGMMEPVAVEGGARRYHITHRCLACGSMSKNVAVPEDDDTTLITIAEIRAMRDN
jgi:hypothetical protein